MKKMIFITVCLLTTISLISCHNEGGNESASTPLQPAQSSNVPSESQTSYIPGDPATAPKYLTEVPETWKIEEEAYWRNTEETCIVYREILNRGTAEESGIDYCYGEKSKKLLRMTVITRPDNATEGKTELSEEQLQKIADDYLASLIPLEYYTERDSCLDRTHDNYGDVIEYLYWLPTPEELPFSQGLFGQTKLLVDLYGGIVEYENGYVQGLESIEYPLDKLDEMMEQVKATPQYQMFLEYEADLPEGSYSRIGKSFGWEEKEDGSLELAARISLRVDSIDQTYYKEEFYFPFADFS